MSQKYIDEAVLYTFTNLAASATASSLIAARTGYKIRVLAVCAISGATATNLTFNSASTAISSLFACGANSGFALGYNPIGWFETTTDSALTGTTGAGSTTGIQIVYIYTV